MNNPLALLLTFLSLFVASVVAHHEQSHPTARPSVMFLWPESPKLNGALSQIVGRNVRVRCYRDEAAWDVRVRSAGYPGGRVVDALTYRGSSETEVAPQRCRALYYALRVGAARANVTPLGFAVNVLSHEGAHLRGIEDEATAEACGRRRIANITNLAFGVKYRTDLMRRVVNAGLALTAYKPPTYQGGTCPS